MPSHFIHRYDSYPIDSVIFIHKYTNHTVILIVYPIISLMYYIIHIKTLGSSHNNDILVLRHMLNGNLRAPRNIVYTIPIMVLRYILKSA